jgi:hypothetical protein
VGDTCLEGCTLPIYKRVVQQHRGGDLIVRFGFEQGDSMEVIRDRAHPLTGVKSGRCRLRDAARTLDRNGAAQSLFKL